MKGTVSFFKLIQGLTGNGSKLVIDEYQRHYVWTKERAINLLKTIISAKDKVFIGSFTIFSPNPSEVQIVDGQQRLVTIYIIMKCLRDIMLGNRETYDKIFQAKNSHVSVQYIERAYNDLIDDKYSGEFKLSFIKKETEEDFDAVIRQGNKSKWKNSQIEKNYNAIKSFLLENKPEILCDTYLNLLNTVECCSMECDSQVEAYRTFASINGLGQKVEDKYTIINIIFQHLGEANKTICNLIEDNDKSFISRFLFFKTGKWTNRKDVISDFNIYMAKTNGETVVKDIIDFDNFDKDSIKYIENNYLIPIPAMQVVVNHLRANEYSSRDVYSISNSFSGIFTRMQICPGTDHITETNIAQIITKIKSLDDIKNYVNFESNTGRLYYPDDKQFKERLMVFDAYHSSIFKKFFLSAVNNCLSKCENFLVENVSVEHIMPQKGNQNNLLLHRIGNLTLTDVGKNSVMGTKDFKKKKEVLSNSVYALNKYFDGIEEWTDEEIIKRTEYLADIATKIWNICQ